MNTIAENDKEILIGNLAIKWYRNELKRINHENEALKNKKFQMGTVVRSSRFTGNIPGKNTLVGKIIGWDFEKENYRVYFVDLEDDHEFITCINDIGLEEYHGIELPIKIAIYNCMDINRINLDIFHIHNSHTLGE